MRFVLQLAAHLCYICLSPAGDMIRIWLCVNGWQFILSLLQWFKRGFSPVPVQLKSAWAFLHLEIIVWYDWYLTIWKKKK